MRAASVGAGPAGLCSLVEGIRNEFGIATTAAGDIDGADHVNLLLAAGRADLCCLVRPHPTPADAVRALVDHLTWPQPPCAGYGRLYPPAARAAPATEKVSWRG